jgi:hypothetical protein
MRTTAIILTLCLAASSQAALIHYSNTEQLDWDTTPIDIRFPADEQPGDSGVMAVEVTTHTINGPPRAIKSQGLEVIGEEYEIGSLVQWVRSSIHGLLYEQWKAAFYQSEVAQWIGDEPVSIDLNGRSAFFSFGLILLRVQEQDGIHYGYLVTDFRSGHDEAYRWAYETEPGVIFDAALPLPEPNGAILLGCLAGAIVVCGWRCDALFRTCHESSRLLGARLRRNAKADFRRQGR